MMSAKSRPPRPIDDSRLARFPLANVRFRSSAKSSIGSATRRSTSTNMPRMRTPPITEPSTAGLVHPIGCPPYGWMP